MNNIPAWLDRAFSLQLDNTEQVKLALTHRSFAKHHNERLEYLGDAVLDVIIGEALYIQFPESNEGVLSRYRAELVRGESLASIARSIELGAQLRLGIGEEKTGGRDRDSNLAGAFEAVVGALYNELGLEQCKPLILPLFSALLANIEQQAKKKDPKTELQEWLQAKKLPLPQYRVSAVSGQDHQQCFTVELSVESYNASIKAEGNSKKQAQQAAAKEMLNYLASLPEQTKT